MAPEPPATCQPPSCLVLDENTVATIDEDGYYFIVDRKKDLIIRGGYNVYPREVEEASTSIPPSPRPPS